MYKLRGSATLQCHNGKWSERVPHCVPTTVLTNFTPHSPPTILLRIPTGSASVEPSGELAVFPGSIVHLECLYSRKQGTPEWSWTATHRQYLTGWAIAADERDWKYRLSVYYSKPLDSGTFTCRTPEEATNSVTVRVAAVHCSQDRLLSRDPALAVHAEGSRLGQAASFSCPVGYTIKGAAAVTCTGSGHWSSPPPTCVPIRCPALVITDPRMRLVEMNISYGGHAIFSCAFGYTLDPRPGLMCESTGQWDRPVPRCKPILCKAMPVPKHGTVVEFLPPETALRTAEAHAETTTTTSTTSTTSTSTITSTNITWTTEAPSDKKKKDSAPRQKLPPLGVGASLRYACYDRYQLIGEPSIVCTETGHWSHPAPTCKPRCPYPGEPANGRLQPVKFAYVPGDKITVSCNAGYVAPLEARPECRPNGTWSEPLPTCTIYSEV